MRKSTKRILLFVHYNKWGELAEYVVFLLQHMRKIFAKVVLISNSPLSEKTRAPLAGLYDDFIQRENKGFDFLAWKEALLHEGKGSLVSYDSVTLMNDTCFGPLFDLRPIYHQMEMKRVDFWGMTNHRGTDKGLPGTNGPIPEHIQSYFLSFRRNVVNSITFCNFWEQITCCKDVNAVIRNYETQLTHYLQKAGFSAAVLCDTRNFKLSRPNAANHYPVLMLQQHVPFLKIKTFFNKTPLENTFLFSSLRKNSRYPLALIYSHLSRHFPPEQSITVIDHGLKRRTPRNHGTARNLQSALHIHAFYPEILDDILVHIARRVRSPLDIFITTSSDKNASQIRQMLQRDFPHLHVRKVLVFENQGRDVWPWLRVAPQLAEYDLAGHIHTKKAELADPLVGKAWLEELLASLLDQFERIRSAFLKEPSLGIVIPDIPTHFIAKSLQYKIYESMDKLLPVVWQRLNCKKDIDFSSPRVIVFPYGNMFWYRPSALSPLWRASWNRNDMPREPIPINGTILHAIERLPVYIAWSEGYDFRIVRPASHNLYGFFCCSAAMNSTLKKGAAQKAETQKSTVQYLRSQVRNRFLLKSHGE